MLTGLVITAPATQGAVCTMQAPAAGNLYQQWSRISPDGRIYNRGTPNVLDVANANGGLYPGQEMDLWYDKGKSTSIQNQSFAYMNSQSLTVPYKLAMQANTSLCLQPEATPNDNLIGNRIALEENWFADSTAAPSEAYQAFLFVATN